VGLVGWWGISGFEKWFSDALFDEFSDGFSEVLMGFLWLLTGGLVGFCHSFGERKKVNKSVNYETD
jgi:hypothetical protein